MNDGHNETSTDERKLRWDEENRLLSSDDNGFVTNYWYDADGERTVKTSGEGEQIYVNSEFAGGRTNTAKFSLYVSPYLVANQGGRYTKHIYIGNQRIVSKLGDLDSYGSDPRRIPYAGSEADAVSIDYKTKYASQQQVIKDNYAAFDVPYNGEDNNDYVDGEGFCCNDGSMEAAQARALARAKASNFQDADAYEKMQFYYHPDHLGSSSYITDLDGEVVQHIEYVPFGEVFIEERNNTWNTLYLFNAKEFDEETGMYYYGARYYEPRLSLWISTDPLQEKYPNIATYIYCKNSPIIFADLLGLEPTEEEAARMSADVYKRGSVTLTGGWHRSKLADKIKGVVWNDDASGFKSALYERNYKGKIEYTYATAGTDFNQINDWKNNFQQIIGKSEQYDISKNNAKIISNVIGKHELTFTGHSLGGGLAATNAFATGRKAMTFNAAWVSPNTIAWWNRKTTKIDAFINVADELNAFQKLFGVRANGTPHYRFSRRALLGHSIENFYRTNLELMRDNVKNSNALYQNMYIQSPHIMPY